MNLHNISAK